MEYRQRPGIVLTRICDQNVLIPTRIAYEHCNGIRILPFLWAITWGLLDKEDAEEKIIKIHRILTKKSDEAIKAQLNLFLKDMEQNGFVIKASSESPEM